MVREVRREPASGTLISFRLTQTGFVQNFFDNPKLQLDRTTASADELQLFAEYIKAKFAALSALHEGFQPESVSPCP